MTAHHEKGINYRSMQLPEKSSRIVVEGEGINKWSTHDGFCALNAQTAHDSLSAIIN